MKNILLIIFAILLAGCVAEREGEPTVDAQELLNCPEIVEQAAKNLEQLKIEPLLVQAWKQNVLSKEVQPCNACQQLNVAAYVLKDEDDVYKPAMLEFINNIGEDDPNKAPTNIKPYIGGSSVDNQKMESYALVEQYMESLDDLQTFLSTEIQMPALDARYFVLDNYFIPLLQEKEKIQDVNQP